MQFIFESRGARKLARALEKFLASKGVKLPLGQAMDALAVMQGFADWNSLAASLTPEAVDALLDAFEKNHIEHNLNNSYDSEGELRTHTGFALRFPLHPEECSYVRILDPLGREIAYWVDQEWGDAPAEVMGAVIGALARGKALTPKAPRKAAPPKGPRVEGTINLYVGTYSDIEWGPSPQWAKIEITQGWLEEVLRLREIALTHDIDSVTQWAGPLWAERNSDDDEDVQPMRMDMGKLHVRSDRFWYAARPKHTDDDVETVGVDFDPLLKALANETSSEYLRYGDDIVWGAGGVLVDDLRDAGEALPQFPASEEPQEG